jgi:hypothetical protein
MPYGLDRMIVVAIISGKVCLVSCSALGEGIDAATLSVPFPCLLNRG